MSRHSSFVRMALPALLVPLVACSSPPSPAESALAGGAVGAGTGALVGAAMVSGDVAKSALLGGAIGIPLGLVAGLAYEAYQLKEEERSEEDEIRSNQEEIYRNEREIERMRQRVESEIVRGNPDDGGKDHLYTGQTLGNPFRK